LSLANAGDTTKGEAQRKRSPYLCVVIANFLVNGIEMEGLGLTRRDISFLPATAIHPYAMIMRSHHVQYSVSLWSQYNHSLIAVSNLAYLLLPLCILACCLDVVLAVSIAAA
jgi:hypothetical protein